MRASHASCDTLAASWIDAARGAIRQDWQTGRHARRERATASIDLAIGQHSHSFRLRRSFAAKGEDPGFSIASFEGPELEELCTALREACHPAAWPVRIRSDLDQARSWSLLGIEAVGLAGILPRSRSLGHRERAGLDEVVEASHIIGQLCRPSNRPVRAWSTQDNLAGAEHVHIMAIHARTEPEALLKKLWSHDGVEGLREIVAGRRLPEGRWIRDMRFISADLEDLDLYPMGRVLTGRDALDEIAEAVSLLNEAARDENGPSPE